MQLEIFEEGTIHLPVAHDNIHDSFLDEVHLWPNCTLFDDDISCKDKKWCNSQFSLSLWFIKFLDTWLKNFVLKLCDNFRNKRGISICEERHWSDQSPTVVVYHVLAELFRKLPKNQFLVEELTLISVLKIPEKLAELWIRYCCLKLLSDLVSCVSGQLPVSHILFHLLHLLPVDWKASTWNQNLWIWWHSSQDKYEPRKQDFKKEPVLAARGVKGLYEVGGMPKEHCVAGSPAHHAQHRQPHVCQRLWGKPGWIKS